jgi:V-type H+-transporting ATPase subunit a
VTKEEIRKYLHSINAFEESQVSAIQIYKWFIRKEKCLYTTLNKFKLGNTLLFGLFWLPDSKKDELNNRIMRIKEDRNISGPQIWKRDNHNVPEPSYFKLNEFTFAFQEITNTYGVPNYKEVNPSVFGVMFGDIGHGFLLFLLGVVAVLAAERLKDGPLDALAQARYLVLMMGFFATFNGICYNDFMSIPVDTGTCYNIDDSTNPSTVTPKDDCVYAIGIDPTWYLAENELNYINGFKMKMSVIFGVTQMTLGIFMKAFNAIYFRRMIDLFFEFLPQLFLLMCLFGFMDLLIVVKWLTSWTSNSGKSPSIITIMINMFLNQGKVDEEIAVSLIGSSSTQQSICIVLLLISLICIPSMLFVKPIYLYLTAHKHEKRGSFGHRYSELQQEEEKDNKPSAPALSSSAGFGKSKSNEEINLDEILKSQGHGDEDHSFGELFIHQLIETIEFALGTVSNTASYLRLWALSLAHSQLAHVFYDKLLGSMALSKGGNFLMVFLLFPAFFSFTLFVLL